MKAIKKIEYKIHKLSPELIEELEHYLDYLLKKQKVRKSGELKQDWAGGLKDVNFNSVELQKKALEWRRMKDS